MDTSCEQEKLSPKGNFNEDEELLHSLPKQKGWGAYDLLLFQNFWIPPFYLKATITFLKHFQAKHNDIIVVSLPKSGTTWLKALAFAIAKRNNFIPTSQNDDHPLLHTIPHSLVPFLETIDLHGNDPNNVVFPHLSTLSEPRIFEAFEKYVEGIFDYGPFWSHMLGYWKASKDTPNKVLFLKYDELKANTNFEVKRMAQFLDCPFTEEEESGGVIDSIIELCSFEKMKELEVNKSGKNMLKVDVENKHFFRKGETGDWVNYFSPYMTEKLSKIIEENLGGKVKDIKKLPPGTYGWPLVGESYQFFFRKLDDFLKERKDKYCQEVFITNLLGEPTVVLCGPTANKLVSMNEPNLVKIQYLKTQRRLFNIPEPKDHIHSHKPSTPPKQEDAEKANAAAAVPVKTLGFLKPEGLVKYMKRIESIIHQHFRTYWEGRKKVEVYPLMMDFSLRLMLQFYLGIEVSDIAAAKLATLFADLFSGIYSIPVNIPGTKYHRALKASAAIREEIQRVIKEKMDALSKGLEMEDLLASIVGAEQSGKYVPKIEITNVIMGLMNASYNSVATTLTFMIKHIGLSPEIYQRVVSEHAEIAKSRDASAPIDWECIQRMKYTWAVAQETMRLYPTAPGAFRVAATDISFAGFTIPKGCKIFWAITSTNKDGKYFKEAEKFDPSRFEVEEGAGSGPYGFIPFGAGPRTCPGKDYARFGILAFIHNLVTKFKWEVVLPHEHVSGALIPFPAHHLPIRLHPLV
ncbi:beta-amyrin 28-monooxygenase-like [Senna tora]|uniref:Beta-amyrin 28-monooxygenase-like n=1 Tax=Senna tora TaxID=362788 RepID=A0A834X2A0_9FABA|nr:beta-amyrin 28-monooxygenase-like [Senna tora]